MYSLNFFAAVFLWSLMLGSISSKDTNRFGRTEEIFNRVRRDFSRDDESLFDNELDDETLEYSSSEKFPRQIAVINSTANMGIVIDSMGEKILICNGENGHCVIIDGPLEIGVEIQDGGWYNVEEPFKSFVRDINITLKMEEHYESVFPLKPQKPTHSIFRFVKSILSHFGQDIAELVLDAGEKLFKLVLRLFGFIIHPLKNVLGPVIKLAKPGWHIFKGGFLALLKIFKWVGKLVGSISGGIAVLIGKAIRFPLYAIMSALNGAAAFFLMLMELVEKFDLTKILGTIIKAPLAIAKFIAGLGGDVHKGITGVFSIIARIMKLVVGFTTNPLRRIGSAISSITKMLLKFFSWTRPKEEELHRCANQLLEIPDKQDVYFQNADQFAEYKQFLGAVKGEENLEVDGVEISVIIKNLVSSVYETGMDLVVKVLDSMKSKVPFNSSIPTLLFSTIKMLNTTDGVTYVQRLIPSLKIHPRARMPPTDNNFIANILRHDANTKFFNYRNLKDLHISQLLRQVPVINHIYDEINKSVVKFHESGLRTLLGEDDEVSHEIKAWTTRALDIPNE